MLAAQVYRRGPATGVTAALRDFKSVYVRFGSGKRAWLRAL